MKPVLKWSGGKSKILPYFKVLYENVQHDRFIDLFCGSLALPLSLVEQNCVFNDINSCLINFYRVVKDFPEELLENLQTLNSSEFNTVDAFKKIRAEYNLLKNEKNISVRLAVIFLYLNKRSYNGLYRENRSGHYNVPYRRYNTQIYCENEILEMSAFFREKNVTFYSKNFLDFKLSFFKKGDLVYLDPPYFPSEKSKFTSYWKTPFLKNEQKELFLFCKKLDKKGVKFIVSNSPCPEIREMYKEFKQQEFYVGRQMRDARTKRTTLNNKIHKENEILIWNFGGLKFDENSTLVKSKT